MGVAKSFKEAEHIYNKSINLSKNWINKYYQNKDYSFFGVSLERVQSFSQHYFFSSLQEGLPIEQIWSQYPVTTQGTVKINIVKQVKILLIHTKNILITLVSPKPQLLNLHSKKDIVFITSGRHLVDQLYLLTYLKKKFKILIIGKIQQEIQEKLKSKNLDFVNISSGMKSVGHLERLKNIFLFSLSRWTKKRYNPFLNGRAWRIRLLYLRLVQFPEIKALLSIAHNILANVKPSIILTTTSNDTFGASFSLMAKSMKIPVIELDHGYTAWSEDNAFVNSDFKLFWGNVFAFLAPSIKDKMVKVGCPYLSKSAESAENKLFNLHKRPHIRILVLWSPPYGSVSAFKSRPNNEVLHDLIRGLSNLPQNFSITLRSHPSYDITHDLAGLPLQKRIRVFNKNSIEKALKDHDVVVTQPTTAGLYAILKRKSMIYFDNSWFTEHFGHPFVKSKCALWVPVERLINIDKFVFRLISNPSLLKSQRLAQKKFIDRYIEWLGEDSCRKIENFIKSIILKKSSYNHRNGKAQ